VRVRIRAQVNVKSMCMYPPLHTSYLSNQPCKR
jgi:hypothetical protein